MIDVVCVKAGTKYDADYVNKLAAMLQRNTTREYTFYCLTDDTEGVKTRTLLAKNLPPSWWAKLYIFNVIWRAHQVIYLDLDTIIAGNVDFLFDYDGRFCIIPDFWQPCYNSSVMSFRAGFGYKLYEEYVNNREAIERIYPGDQDYLSVAIPDADLWMDGIGSYKAHQLNDGPGDYPIVCFHGEPKPHQLPKEHWGYELWNKN